MDIKDNIQEKVFAIEKIIADFKTSEEAQLNRSNFEQIMKEINELLLKSKFEINGCFVEPLFVESYYRKINCFGDGSEALPNKGPCDGHKEQINRPFTIYFTTGPRRRFDLVLSNTDNFAYSVLIKSSIINGRYCGQTSGLDILNLDQNDQNIAIKNLKYRDVNNFSDIVGPIQCDSRVNVENDSDRTLVSYLVPPNLYKRKPKIIKAKSVYKHLLAKSNKN